MARTNVIFKVNPQHKNIGKLPHNNNYILSYDSLCTTIFNSKENVRKSFPNLNIVSILESEHNKRPTHSRNITRSIKNPKEIIKKAPLNSFFAFRTYYSQFGKGLNQNILSTILSREWKKNKEERHFWNNITEQYKQIKDI